MYHFADSYAIVLSEIRRFRIQSQQRAFGFALPQLRRQKERLRSNLNEAFLTNPLDIYLA